MRRRGQAKATGGCADSLWRWRLALAAGLFVGLAALLLTERGQALASRTGAGGAEASQAQAATLALGSKRKALRCEVRKGPFGLRPGRPCLPPARAVAPYGEETVWRVKLGERVLAAATGQLTEAQCGTFMLSRHAAWCTRAMRQREGVVGFSYGIAERDAWSETLSSNAFRLRTKLYDCNTPPQRSPVLAGTAPSGGPCPKNAGACYETPYESFRVCLGAVRQKAGSLKHETLASHLKGRQPLSAHVKIDVRGAEWAVLEQILASPELAGRIRTLDVRLHFGLRLEDEQLPEREALERRVRALERLRELFWVVGSDLEAQREDWKPEEDCARPACPEPRLHLPMGLSVDQLTVSFVNRRLVASEALREGGSAVAPSVISDEEPQAAPAPVPAPPPAAPAAPCRRAYSSPSSRPGVPCMPPADEDPFVTSTEWREKLGERILAAVTGHLSEEECGGFELFGDSTWCLKVMKRKGVVGFSYGIEERDLWSEKMSNVFHMPTRLYDCFIPPERSPPIAGTAPNGTESCEGQSGHCYETPYQSFRICLGPTAGSIGGRRYETLASHLRDRGPLSTHLKIDSEGTEWAVLEQLLASPEDQDKIRTLEMEVHFSFGHEGDAAAARVPEQERLEKRVRVMERLLDRFQITGSNLEVYREDWKPEVVCGLRRCREPAVHLRRGMSVDQFAVSYVNRRLLASGDDGADADGEAAPAAAVLPAETRHYGGGPRGGGQAASEEEDDGPCVKKYTSASSRPGKPCIDKPLEHPYNRPDTPWRVALGKRIFAAAIGRVTEEECGQFELFGDSTWCMKVMHGKGVLGLSYGIEERDLWSEKMSNVFHMPTRLYDCFIPPNRSPPMERTAPNGTQSCEGVSKHCYETPYDSFRICLGPEVKTIHGRRYETLASHLKGRGRLSTHVKIDSEGTEWAVLKQLLKSPEDMDKIRTLEMEVHFSFVPEGDDAEAVSMSEQDRLEQRVGIMEGLLDRFRVTGSNLEVYREYWHPDKECPGSSCGEPAVHFPGGMSLDQFAISYVHRDLIAEGAEDPAMSQAQPPPAAAEGDEEEAAPAPAAPGSWPPPPRPKCKAKYHDASSRPGVPCMPRAKEHPYSSERPWRAQLGERVLAAVAGTVTEEECDGFQLYGDSTWCNKVMRGKGVVGFSYGIEERDTWSEKMSNVFHMPTRLYDCFIPPGQSPPIAKTAPNATGSCDSYPGICYETMYESFRICLGPEEKIINGRQYETLAQHLKGYPPLSLHVKIDSEGTEWAVLEQLLQSPEDMDKIRTLEMEVHFSYLPEGDDPKAKALPEQERLNRRVAIMERLLERFRCTGTNLEVYRESWKPEIECRGGTCDEPALYQYRGMSVDQFAVSYVHKDLL